MADISAWIIRQAIALDDSRSLLAGVGTALNEAGVPLRRLAVGIATLNLSHRGINMTWDRDEGTRIERTAHGAESEAAFERSTIGATLAERLTSNRWRIESGEGCNRFPLLAELRDKGCTDYVLTIVGFPAGTALRGAGLVYVADRPEGFSDDDLTLIAEHRDALGLALLRLALSRSLHNLIGAYAGEGAAARILAGNVRRGVGELVEAAILLVDLKRFTATADKEDPKKLVGWLDEHLDALGHAVEREGGDILKFTGDGFVALFPVLDPAQSPAAVAAQALAAARAGLERNRALERQRRDAGLPALEADLALHYGQVVYGNIGTAGRLDFTAIGAAMNEASRIEALCDEVGRHLLVSDRFARLCGSEFVSCGCFTLRGVEAPQQVWTVPEG